MTPTLTCTTCGHVAELCDHSNLLLSRPHGKPTAPSTILLDEIEAVLSPQNQLDDRTTLAHIYAILMKRPGR